MSRIERTITGLLLAFSLLGNVYGQVWRGIVVDGETGEPLSYASLVDTLKKEGTVTNERGVFLLKASSETVVEVKHAGYVSAYFSLSTFNPDDFLSFGLKTRSVDTVQIDGTHPATLGMIGRISFSPTQVRDLPALGGEPDLVKALQMLPAVSGGREGSGALHVRGGSAGQNLYIIDGMPINHSGHLFNLFSVFNPDVLGNVDFYASGFPLRYGGRLSSVVDVGIREGNRNKWKGKAELGVVSSRVLVEGPLSKKSSLLLGLRSSYLDLFNLGKARQIEAERWEPRQMTNLGFSDFNGKYVFSPDPTKKFSLSLYAGHDRLLDLRNDLIASFRDKQNMLNAGASARFQWVPNSAWYMEVGLFSVLNRSWLETENMDFRRTVIEPPDSLRFLLPEVELDTLQIDRASGVYQLLNTGAYWRADYTFNNQHHLKAGIQTAANVFWPGDLSVINESREPDLLITEEDGSALRRQAFEWSAYTGYAGTFGTKLNLDIGLRYAGFSQDNQTYTHVLPRMLVSWRPGPWGAIQLA
ncbi:MAG: TonB-dependent receptor, partial [Bacteroidota bacterium]